MDKYKIVYAVPPHGGSRVAEIWEDGRRLCALPPDYIDGTLDGLIADANNAARAEELECEIENLKEEIDDLKSEKEGE